MELSHEALKDLIAPYVLGAVSSEEERAIREHVSTCDECRGELESFGGVAGALALTTAPGPVPADFVNRVVARADAERQAPAARTLPSRYRRLLGWQVALSGALLIIGIVLAVLFVNEHNNLQERQRALAALLHHEQEGMDLRGQSGVVAKVIPISGGSIFVASGLDEAPAGHTYQLWFIKNGTPVSGGTFEMKGGLAVLENHKQVSAYDGAAVTIEPEGGSDQPTTQPIITSG